MRLTHGRDRDEPAGFVQPAGSRNGVASELKIRELAVAAGDGVPLSYLLADEGVESRSGSPMAFVHALVLRRELAAPTPPCRRNAPVAVVVPLQSYDVDLVAATAVVGVAAVVKADLMGHDCRPLWWSGVCPDKSYTLPILPAWFLFFSRSSLDPS